MRVLFQTQLSNFVGDKANLAGDSGWQMCVGRIREMLKLSPDLLIDITGPLREQLVEQPEQINPDLFQDGGPVLYKAHRVIPSALATRYDFSIDEMDNALSLTRMKPFTSVHYDIVYINDPLLLRHYKALFFLRAGYMPKFVVHSHFVDCPSSPKFPQETSLWLGQLEACQRADYNFWQCQTALNQFEDDARKLLRDEVVDEIMKKSSPYDDGYSIAEITSQINYDNIRFDVCEFEQKTKGKKILFFPNRISTGSNDFTRGMKFMFEILPKLYEHRQDFVVIAGNPNQKFSNKQLEEKCGAHGYVSVGDDAFNRNEYKFVAKNSHVVIGAYDVDTYGGTASRECITLGMMPIWANCNEYAAIAKEAKYPFLYNPDFSNFIDTLDKLLNTFQISKQQHLNNLQRVIKERCSYEVTTRKAMEIMCLPIINII